MKTINSLKESLNELRENSSPYALSDKDYKAAQREARRLTDAILCLEKLPTKERVEKEKLQLDEKIQKFDDGYSSWIKSTPASFYADKDPRKVYEREVGLDKMRKQKRVLEFLLN